MFKTSCLCIADILEYMEEMLVNGILLVDYIPPEWATSLTVKPRKKIRVIFFSSSLFQIDCHKAEKMDHIFYLLDKNYFNWYQFVDSEPN